MADFQGQKERLKAFVKYTGLPVYKFEARCGLSNGYISSMRKLELQELLGEDNVKYIF